MTAGVVFDAHQDIVYEVPAEERSLMDHLFSFDLHLDQLQAGGIDAEIFAICIAGECLRISPAMQIAKISASMPPACSWSRWRSNEKRWSMRLRSSAGTS